jgi:hypothetical protein
MPSRVAHHWTAEIPQALNQMQILRFPTHFSAASSGQNFVPLGRGLGRHGVCKVQPALGTVVPQLRWSAWLQQLR